MAIASHRFLLSLSSIICFVIVIDATTHGTFTAEKNHTADGTEQIQVKVYYETLCSDSISFIQNRLFHAMFRNNWLNITDLQFVPYGKVSSYFDKKTKKTILNCQHGPHECEQNALHACIVDNHSQKEQLLLIDCLLGMLDPQIDTCAEKCSIDVTAAKKCIAERSIPDILLKYGEETDALDIHFVPTITFDGEFERWEERRTILYFENIFCKKFRAKFGFRPENC